MQTEPWDWRCWSSVPTSIRQLTWSRLWICMRNNCPECRQIHVSQPTISGAYICCLMSFWLTLVIRPHFGTVCRISLLFFWYAKCKVENAGSCHTGVFMGVLKSIYLDLIILCWWENMQPVWYFKGPNKGSFLLCFQFLRSRAVTSTCTGRGPS